MSMKESRGRAAGTMASRCDGTILHSEVRLELGFRQLSKGHFAVKADAIPSLLDIGKA